VVGRYRSAELMDDGLGGHGAVGLMPAAHDSVIRSNVTPAPQIPVSSVRIGAGSGSWGISALAGI
jgi:hypothetical protein